MTEITLPQFPLWWQVKFWEEHYKWNLETGCLEWQGKVSRFGYARTSYNSIIYFAHRIAYFLYYENDPGELLVRHRCHNPHCGNPLHLTLGTHLDNSRDMVAAGRNQTGERHWTKRLPKRLEEVKEIWVANGRKQAARINGANHPTTILTDDAVREIKQQSAAGIGNKELAKEYGVTRSNISAIVLGKSWKHIE